MVTRGRSFGYETGDVSGSIDNNRTECPSAIVVTEIYSGGLKKDAWTGSASL